MPRWASRLTLEITDVRVQRVREISEEDALAEGVNSAPPFDLPSGWKGNLFTWRFSKLWDYLNLKRGFGWDMNPWVWAITFKRVAQ